MKTKAFLLFILLIGFISCSKDDSCIINTDEVLDPASIFTQKSSLSLLLLAKDENTEYNIKANYEYFYTGSKIDSITSINNIPGSTKEIKIIQKFTYTGNLITETNTYSNALLSNHTTYKYNDNNQLIEVVYTDYNDSKDSYKEVFENLKNGSITGTLYTGTNFNEKKSTNLISFNEQGNIDQIDITHLYPTFQVKETITYSYDQKNYWLKNVIGIAATSYTNNESTGINNNIITETTTINDSNEELLNYSYTYDQHGFPLSMISTSNDDSNTIVTGQFFY